MDEMPDTEEPTPREMRFTPSGVNWAAPGLSSMLSYAVPPPPPAKGHFRTDSDFVMEARRTALEQAVAFYAPVRDPTAADVKLTAESFEDWLLRDVDGEEE